MFIFTHLLTLLTIHALLLLLLLGWEIVSLEGIMNIIKDGLKDLQAELYPFVVVHAIVPVLLHAIENHMVDTWRVFVVPLSACVLAACIMSQIGTSNFVVVVEVCGIASNFRDVVAHNFVSEMSLPTDIWLTLLRFPHLDVDGSEITASV